MPFSPKYNRSMCQGCKCLEIEHSKSDVVKCQHHTGLGELKWINIPVNYLMDG